MFGAFLADQRGATAIEYALIGSLISIFIIGALLLFQSEMTEMYQYISNNLTPALAGN